MKANKRTLLTLILVLTVSLLVIAAAIYLAVAAKEKYKDQRYTLYFLSSSAPVKIESESRYFFLNPEEDLPRALVQALIAGPESEQLVSPFPGDLHIANVSRIGNTLSVMLSEQYNALDPYAQNLADCCLYQTVSALPGINKIYLRITGDEYNTTKLLTGDRFLSSDRFFETTERKFTLYFPNAELSGLQKADYSCLMSFGQSEIETVLKLLEFEAFPLHAYGQLPSSLVHVAYVYNDVAHVDLSADLLIIQEAMDTDEYSEKIEQNRLYLQAIVTTLTSLDNIGSVMFTFDNTVMEEYGELNLSKPLTIYNFQ